MRLVSGLLLFGLSVGGVVPAAAADTAVVSTDRGLVRGQVHDGYRTFDGIPFAAPPVGVLRWAPPQPAPRWPGVRDATAPGSRCAQSTDLPNPVGVAEDCLYLNVTTPRTAGTRPVLVWLHGGGFAQGSGSDYVPSRMANAGEVVVVTVNYRLGVFGYFGLPGLAGSGTFGLQDQMAALAWVRRNAAFLGGDPGNVTVAGQSAGAMSACSLLASPAAAGLFAKMIIQSGSCLADYPDNAREPGERATSPWIPRTRVEAAGSRLAADLGCGSAADVAGCLRVRPTADLLARTNEFRRIAYDTPILPERPAAALRDRRVAAVPVLSGGTRDEGRLFAAAFYRDGIPIDGARYRDLLADAFGPAAGEVGRRYPVSAYGGNPALAWTTVVTDVAWACPTLAANRLLARRGPTYAYEFADRDAFPLFVPPPDFPTGAYHSSELGYLFDFPGFALPLSPAQRILSERMIGYWTRFAHTGDPNGPDLPRWPRFTPNGSWVPALAPGGAGVRPVDVSAEHRCGFWNPGT